MLELYNFQQSTCSQKVRFLLAEKGLEWVDKRLDSRRGEQLKPDYLAINPNGLVPSLVHDGAIILDSSVIMEYLDEIFPDTSMVPADPVSRAHMRKWLRYMEEVPTPAVRYPSFQNYLIRSFKHLDDEAMEAQAKRRPLRTDFYRRMGTDGFTAAEIQTALDNLHRPTGAIRAGDFKLIEWFEDDRVELYNLHDDLGETKNLAAEMPEKADELRAALHAWRHAVDARMPTPNPDWEAETAGQ